MTRKVEVLRNRPRYRTNFELLRQEEQCEKFEGRLRSRICPFPSTAFCAEKKKGDGDQQLFHINVLYYLLHTFCGLELLRADLLSISTKFDSSDLLYTVSRCVKLSYSFQFFRN